MQRRDFLLRGGAAGATLGATLGLRWGSAQATTEQMLEAIGQATGGAGLRRGRIAIDLPPLVENGNTVPLTVRVDSPMTPDDHVASIHVFVEKNPQPFVATFHLGPRAGRAVVSTRIRLADSQAVTVVARMSDGSFWSASADSVVTMAACTEST